MGEKPWMKVCGCVGLNPRNEPNNTYHSNKKKYMLIQNSLPAVDKCVWITL